MDRLVASEIALPGVEARVVESCDSTNTRLMKEARLRRPVLLAAEVQTAGRGRRGRRWHSRLGDSITFSLACRVERPLRELAGLSLVAGVAVARALRRLGAGGVALKWPNDILAGGAKLGGILVESRVQDGAPVAVVGIGLNYLPDATLARRLRRPVASLKDVLPALPERNFVIRAVAEELLGALRRFERAGVEAVRDEWSALHAHAGQRLKVRLDDGRTVSGIAAGLAEDGALRLQTRGGVRAIRTGHVIAARLA